MNQISKYKLDKPLVIILLILSIISILTIWSATQLLPEYMNDLFIKQGIWYIIGIIIVYFVMTVKNKFIYEHIWYFYWLICILLVILLLFGTPINNTKAWFVIPFFGSFQPSEFMKIILIITLAKTADTFNKSYNSPSIMEEFRFIFKMILITFIPSILTFMQPDTGVVLIYLIILGLILFTSGIRIRWFVIMGIILSIIVGTVLITYYSNTDLFIDIFGTDFFLRVDRLLDWSTKSGYQLENGMSAIGAGGLFGTGLGNTPIYFPEPQTDFIFAVYSNNFGFVGASILLLLLIIFDLRIIVIISKSRKSINKYIGAGIIGMLVYQQFQNIGMTFGIMPITGITLPFISYGGSSLLSYMIIMGIIFNIANKNLRYTN